MPFHVSAEFIWKNYARQRRSLQRHFNGPMCNFTTKMNEKKEKAKTKITKIMKMKKHTISSMRVPCIPIDIENVFASIAKCI